jgi:hypothetical protein
MYDVGTQLSVLSRPKFLALLREHRPWLSPDEAATYLKVSVRTLEAWRSLNKGPTFRKRGKLIRYHIDVLDAFVNEPD